MLRISVLSVLFLFGFDGFAASLYDTKVKGVSIYDTFKKAGVPESALVRAFEFLDVNGGKKVRVKAKVRNKKTTYMTDKDVTVQKNTLAIIDFSKPSTERRLYVLNLREGTVSKHFVAHGKGSGVTTATKFSNIDGSKMSSLGLYLAGNTYIGGHGESLNLYGLEASNNKAASRDIVVHAANYVSEDFVKSQGRLGRSWGCPAVAPGIIKKMITLFKDGGVIYAYHKDLSVKAVKEPSIQETKPDKDEEDIDLPDEEESIRKAKTEAMQSQEEDVIEDEAPQKPKPDQALADD